MELNKKNVRTILLIIVFTVILFTAIQNLGAIFGFVVNVWGVFSSVIAGLAIAFVLNVPLKLFEDKLFYALREHRNPTVRKLLRPVSIVCSLLITLGVLIILLLVVLPQLVEAVAAVFARLPGYVNDLIDWLDKVLEPFDFKVSSMLNGIDWEKTFDSIGENLSDGINSLINTAASTIGTAANVGTTIVSGVIDVVFSIIIAVYILAQKEKIGHFVRRCMLAFLPRRAGAGISRFCTMAAETFSNFISGQLTDSCILGILCFFGMTIFRFPYANVISVVIGVTSLVPLVGSFVGIVIGALLILTMDPLMALLFIVFVLVLQQIEGNLIYPKVVGKAVGLPGVIVLSAVLVGGNIAGVIGGLCAVPISAILYTILREAVESRLTRRQGPRIDTF